LIDGDSSGVLLGQYFNVTRRKVHIQMPANVYTTSGEVWERNLLVSFRGCNIYLAPCIYIFRVHSVLWNEALKHKEQESKIEESYCSANVNCQLCFGVV